MVGSPCTLPILPGFISSLAATGGDDDAGSAAWKPLRLTMAAMVFALGVGLALATTAAVGAWLMQGIAAWRPPLALIPGALLAIAGLATLEWAPLRRLRLGPQALPQPRSATPLLTGLALGVGWTPCATPALGATRIRVVRSALGRSGRAVQVMELTARL